MQKAGLILGGVALSSGIGATWLVMSNLILWAIITAWVGSLLAFIGFGLIVVAISSRKPVEPVVVEAPAKVEPHPA